MDVAMATNKSISHFEICSSDIETGSVATNTALSVYTVATNRANLWKWLIPGIQENCQNPLFYMAKGEKKSSISHYLRFKWQMLHMVFYTVIKSF